MESCHKLLKSKHSYSFKIALPWIKIWRWQCSKNLCNHGFLLCEKFHCLRFKYTELIHTNRFWIFLRCTIVSDIYEHLHIFHSKLQYTTKNTFYYTKKMFYYFTNDILKLLIIFNVYNKVVEYFHFNIFNFKMFCKGYQLYSFLYKHNLYK